MGPSYADAAPEYFDRGYQPIPVSGPTKVPCLKGITGYDGRMVGPADIEGWSVGYPLAGVALRMVGTVGIDVDAYGDKPGAATLAELEADLGPLPKTVVSSSRFMSDDYDGVSGIRVFKLPPAYATREKEHAWRSGDPGIEYARYGHRYVVAWPSVHKRGTTYAWLDQRTGEFIAGPLAFSPEELPELPEAWCEHLLKPQHEEKPPRAKMPVREKKASQLRLTFKEPVEPSEWWTEGEMCRAVRGALKDILDTLADGRHDESLRGVLRLTRLGEQGHQGIKEAVLKLRGEFLAQVTKDGSRTPGVAGAEWNRAVAGLAAEIARGGLTPPENKRCCGPQHSSPDNWGEGETPTVEGDAVDPPTWAPVDLSQFIDGTYEKPTPTLFPRSDGVCLVYPGLTHSFHGESESGKSLIVLVEVVRLIMAGERVLFVDFESDAASIVGRLLEFGASAAAIKDWFVYIRPEVSPRAGRERDAWLDVLAGTFTLAIVDGVTDSLGMFGFSTKENDDITAWAHLLPRRIADRTGAAVIQIDHVTKDSDSRGRFAIGGQAKMSGLTGSAYTVEVVTGHPLGRGLRGVVVLRVGKDRPGYVRQHGGTMRADRTQEVARVIVDSTGASPTVTVEPWQGHGTAPEAPGEFRPTYLMEALSLALEKASEPQSFRALDETVNGKANHKRTALGVLRDEGYITITDGPRNAHLHTRVAPYRQSADPTTDNYVEPPDVGDTLAQP